MEVSKIFELDISTMILYSLTIVLFTISLFKDKNRSIMAVKKGWMAFKKIVPVLAPLFLIVGILLTVVTPEMIKSLIGEDSGIIGVVIALISGSIAFMPPFVTYPLGVELLANGAGYPQVAALVTALMGVGVVYLMAESKFFGWKATILRNILALIAASVVAIVIWMVM